MKTKAWSLSLMPPQNHTIKCERTVSPPIPAHLHCLLPSRSTEQKEWDSPLPLTYNVEHMKFQSSRGDSGTSQPSLTQESHSEDRREAEPLSDDIHAQSPIWKVFLQCTFSTPLFPSSQAAPVTGPSTKLCAASLRVCIDPFIWLRI